MTRAKAALALMTVPLLLAITFQHWPRERVDGFPEISQVVMLRTNAHGLSGQDALSSALAAAIKKHCDGVEGVQIVHPPAGIDPTVPFDSSSIGALGGDAVLQTAITSDGGLLEVGLQLVNTRTGKIVWRKAYQTREDRFAELFDGAAKSLRGALRPLAGRNEQILR